MHRLLQSLILRALLCGLLLFPASLQARSILDLDVKSQPAQLKDWGDFRVDPSASMTPMGAARADGFAPTPERGSYPLAPGAVLWIRFTLPATPDDQRWYVRMSQPGLDEVTLYTRGSGDSWSPLRAGDALPMSQWALPHLYPVLPLNISAADPTRYLLRIVAGDGFSAPVEFVSESWLSREQQRVSLMYGVYFGLLAMGAIYAFATGSALREGAYLWLGGGTALAGLAASGAVGVAGLHFWPESPGWSDAAHHVLPALACVPLLSFVAQALLLRERARILFWLLLGVVVLALAGAVVAGMAHSPWRRWVAQGVLTASMACATGVLLWSWYRGDRFARNLLLALAPLALALPAYRLATLQGAGASEPAWVLLLGGLAVTIGAVYLLLSWRDQAKRDHLKRIAQLQEIDPATGLVNDLVFASRGKELIERAQRFEHQSVVAIVDFPNFPALRSEFGRKYSLELLLRLAERLCAMLRNMDTAARLGEFRFGLLVDGPVALSRARALSAKVIAHCITPMSGLPLGMVAKPRIAMALVPAHGSSMSAVVVLLEDMLRAAADDPLRVILIPDQAHEPVAPAPAPGGTDGAPSTLTRATGFQPTSASDEVD